MQQKDLISVIIPAFNAERYIAETMASVLGQTYPTIELIVVDDGSTDQTAGRASEFAAKDARVVVVRQDNRGVSAARNKGFAVAKGKYIAYTDADDVWMPDHLQLLYDRLATHPELGLVHSDYQEINADSSKRNVHSKGGKEGFLLDGLLLGHIEYIPGPSGILLPRSTVEKTGGFDAELSNVADQDFFYRVAARYEIGRVPRVTWYYRIHSQNMHANIELLEKDTLLSFAKADAHKLFKSNGFRRKCYSNMYLMLAGSFWRKKKNASRVFQYVVKSIWVYPPNIFMFFKKIFL